MIPSDRPPDFSRPARKAFLIGALGLLACLGGVFVEADQFLRSYLWAYWFWMGVAIGCGQLLMIYHLTGGAWGYVTQRILEAALRTMPMMFVAVVPLLIGIPHLYTYAQPKVVAANQALQHKLPYLNTAGVIWRLGTYFFIWWIFAYLLTKWSIQQDETGDQKYFHLRRRISGPGIILYSLAVTFAIVDWIMAIEADWFSTAFPATYLVGELVTAVAAVIIVLRYISKHAPLTRIISPRTFQDLGNLLLAFVLLWAYVETAQLIVLWSGNLPKKILWYLHRTEGDWAWLTFSIALFHVGLPLFVLLGRRNKLRSRRLAAIAAYVFVVHAVTNFWKVAPGYHSQITVSWLDFAAPIGLGGIWVGLLLKYMAGHPLLPAHDVRVADALEKAL